jgi:biopolymer transport protein ExbD
LAIKRVVLFLYVFSDQDPWLCFSKISSSCNRNQVILKLLSVKHLWKNNKAYISFEKPAMQIIEQHKPKSRRIFHSLKIDMTPMVDLGFLLITFFIFTTHMGEAKGLKLYMPADGPGGETGETSTLTAILAGGNKIAVYSGSWIKASGNNAVRYMEFAGLRSRIKQQRETMQAAGLKPADLMLLIKPSEKATFSNTVDALDEAMISVVGRYAIINITKEEQDYVDIK